MISFDPLKEAPSKKGITKYDLLDKGVLTYADIARLETNHNYSLKFINKLCRILNCKVEEVIEYQEN